MVDLYVNNNRFFGYKDSYNYYDIDVNKILLFKKSYGEYVIRYDDVYHTKIVPLQLKTSNFYGEIHTYASNYRIMPIHIDDKELFIKCREIWNKITEIIGINNAEDFVETNEVKGDEYNEVNVDKNTNFAKGNYRNRNKLVIVSDFVIDDYLKTSLVQYIY